MRDESHYEMDGELRQARLPDPGHVLAGTADELRRAQLAYDVVSTAITNIEAQRMQLVRKHIAAEERLDKAKRQMAQRLVE